MAIFCKYFVSFILAFYIDALRIINPDVTGEKIIYNMPPSVKEFFPILTVLYRECVLLFLRLLQDKVKYFFLVLDVL